MKVPSETPLVNTRTLVLYGRRTVSAAALVFGGIGSIVSILVAIAVIWLGMTARGYVSHSFGAVDSGISSVQQRLESLSTQIVNADSTEQLSRITNGTQTVTANLQTTVDRLAANPLYSNAPIDLSRLAAAIDETNQTASVLNTIVENSAGMAINQVKKLLTSAIGAIQARIDMVTQRLNHVEDRLTLTIRVAALAGVLLAAWGLWAQYALLRSSGYAEKLKWRKANQ